MTMNLLERIEKALADFTSGRASMHVPPMDTDVDMVLADCATALEDAEKRIAELGGHLKSAHAFIENTEAFGHEAASGILKCGDSEWNVDASKESLAAAGITVKGE